MTTPIGVIAVNYVPWAVVCCTNDLITPFRLFIGNNDPIPRVQLYWRVTQYVHTKLGIRSRSTGAISDTLLITMMQKDRGEARRTRWSSIWHARQSAITLFNEPALLRKGEKGWTYVIVKSSAREEAITCLTHDRRNTGTRIGHRSCNTVTTLRRRASSRVLTKCFLLYIHMQGGTRWYGLNLRCISTQGRRDRRLPRPRRTDRSAGGKEEIRT